MSGNKDKPRPTITDAALKGELVKLFNKGQTGKTDLYGLLRTKYKLGRDRYFQVYDSTHSEWARLNAKGIGEGIVAGAADAAKNGIKSKTERLMILQEQIDACLTDLDKPKLDIYEKVALRKTIKELQGEISKIEGDYATEKIDVTTKGKSVNTSKLPTDLKKQILAQLRNDK